MTTQTQDLRRVAGRAALAALCGIVLGLAGCQKSPLEQHRAGIEATYAKLRTLEAPVRDAPPLADDARIDAGGARVVLAGPDANAIYVAWVHLGKPETAGPYGTGAEVYTEPMQTCGMALAGQPPTFRQEPEIAAHLQQCAKAEYAFVLRTLGVEYAKLVDEKTFQPGFYDGEVRLYRLADSADLGGFRVSASNGDEITVAVGQHGADASASVALNDEVKNAIQRQIGERLRAQVPGVVP